MSLVEMTEEQLEAVARCIGETAAPPPGMVVETWEMADIGDVARAVWPVIRDMVLEACARKALGHLKGPPYHQWDEACCAVATSIMEMKP